MLSYPEAGVRYPRAVGPFICSQPNPIPHLCDHRLYIDQSPCLDPIGAVESVKAASDIYAPISGVIEEINETLSDQPGLLNKSPQSDGSSPISSPSNKELQADGDWAAGWLCKMRLTIPSEFEALLNEKAYKAHCEGEEAADDKA